MTTYRYIGRTVEIRGPDKAVTLIENDSLGRPISITDPEKGTTLCSYGPFGWLRTVTDLGGTVTTMKRDPFGRVGKHRNPYSFVLNSPLNYTDPSGFQEEEPGSTVRGTATWSADGTELVVVARDEEREISDFRDPAEVGAAAAPTDVSAFGTSTGFSRPVPPTEAERPRPLDIAREAGIGAAGGAFELWWDATKDFVLFWATGGVYNGIKIWSAIYAGYKEGGTLGALNVLNPIYAILSPAAKSTQAAVDGDYRAAGREGVKALATLAITVVTIALGPKGPGPGGKNSPGGGPNTGAGTGVAPSTLKPGPHAGASIPARGPEKVFTPAEHAQVTTIGRTTGCHTCGTTNPGTRSGHFVPDHQPPSALNQTHTPQRLHPHCINCSRRQGGQVNAERARRRPE